MSDNLLRRIRQGRTEAIEDLRRKGLLPPVKQAIVIDLDRLRSLMREFIDEHADSNSSEMRMQWTFEAFLQWLRERMEAKDGEGTD